MTGDAESPEERLVRLGLIDALGEGGRHARSAIGVAALPLGTPAEVEAIAELSS